MINDMFRVVCCSVAAAVAFGCNREAPAVHLRDESGGDISEAGDVGEDNVRLVAGGRAVEAAPAATDAVSGATPGVAGTALTDRHRGWGQSDCFSCHDSGHARLYRVGDCVSCHGRNNAPSRPLFHADSGCRSCHADSHPGLGALTRDACRACHGTAQGTDTTCAYSEEYDVVVVGGGGGGLAAAAMIARSGLSVLVVEQHHRLGGYMVGFTRGDYRFDTALHAYPGARLGLLRALGIADRITPVAGDTLYRVITPDLVFDVPAEIGAYRDALKGSFPHEADRIDDLFARFTRTGPGYPGLSFLDALAFHGIEDQRFALLFTILAGFRALPPDRLPADAVLPMWEAYHRSGLYYFEGGAQSITDALARAIEENDGVIKRHTRATEITIDGEGRAAGIRTGDGGCYTSAAVVSNASGPATFLSLVGEAHLPAAFADAAKRRGVGASIETAVYLGVNADYTAFFPEDAHSIFVTDGHLATAPRLAAHGCFPEEADLMLTNYSVTDPLAAPAGKNAIVILAHNMGYDCNDTWRFDHGYGPYTAYKQAVADIIIARAEAILPDLREHIEVMEVGTPKTMAQFTLNPRGSWSGWAPGPSGDADLTSIETPVTGLFMAGAWVTGGGQSSSLLSGIQAAAAVKAYLSASRIGQKGGRPLGPAEKHLSGIGLSRRPRAQGATSHIGD